MAFNNILNKTEDNLWPDSSEAQKDCINTDAILTNQLITFSLKRSTQPLPSKCFSSLHCCEHSRTLGKISSASSFPLSKLHILFVFFFSLLYPNGNWHAETWSSLSFLSSVLSEICSLHRFWNQFSGNISPSIVNFITIVMSISSQKKNKKWTT